MKTESGLCYGNVLGEVGEILCRHFRQLPKFVSAMVRCIDSTYTPSGIASILLRYRVEVRLEASSVLLTPEDLHRAACGGVFVCYDEVWLLEGDQPKQAVPLQHNLLPDFGGSKIVPRSFERYMKEIGCVLAVAAGSNLSYATWDGVFAASLENEFEEDIGHEGVNT